MARRPLLPGPPGAPVRLSQELVRKNVTHPEWFHVSTEKDQLKIGVHLYLLPSPDRSLVADWAGVAPVGRTSLSFVFGQQPPGASRMTGALVVQMPRKAVLQVLFSNSEFLDAMNKYAGAEGISPAMHKPDPASYPAERIVTERSQILSVVVGEDEAELRFYRASRSDINAIQNDKKVDFVYPVVEVRMPAEELVHLMHTLGALLEEAERHP
jgi:hypothetical protein